MTTKMTTKTTVNVTMENTQEPAMDEKVTPKGIGCLDMVIAFDTTGSMSAYIDDVRQQVKEMIPRLFKENEDLQLGIVAFGDYCDMENISKYGDAYQCMPLTNNENDLISFVTHARNTSGGDGDEFYELVLQKIIDEMPWRKEASKAILLIADADPHEVGYSYGEYVHGNQIDWREEARKAASQKIKIDTVSICGRPWYKEVSAMTNGICVPFKSSGKTATMIETATIARSAMAFGAHADEKSPMAEYARERMHDLKGRLDIMFDGCQDSELNEVYCSYKKDLDEKEPE